MTGPEFIGAIIVLAFALWALRSARRLSAVDPSHRAVAWFLALAIACDLARLAINTRLAAAGSGPFVGWPRVAFHAEQSMLWTQHLSVVAVAYVALCNVRARIALACTACALYVFSVSVIVRYPELRGSTLFSAYVKAHVACSLAGAIAIGLWIKGSRPRTTASDVAIVLVVYDAIMLAGPYTWGVERHWWMAQMVYTAMFAIIAYVQRRALCRTQ